ncbi:hypothetical protein D3C85_1168850 [compost metagenome]
MAVLLFAQLGIQTRAVRIQAPQFGFLGGAFEVPGMGRIAGVVAFDLQQLDFTPYGCEVGLLGRIGLAQVTDLIATGFELSLQAILGQLCGGQPFIQQHPLGLHLCKAPLQRPGQPQARQRRRQ